MDLLRALHPRPLTPAQLRQKLCCSQVQLEASLYQLQRGGYVAPAIPNEGACASGCGGCSVKNFCASNLQEGESWRLTVKGQRRVEATP